MAQSDMTHGTALGNGAFGQGAGLQRKDAFLLTAQLTGQERIVSDAARGHCQGQLTMSPDHGIAVSGK